MNIVITAGCPHSGWEMVLPTLQQGGFELDGGSFTRWHDELFRTADVEGPLQLRRPLQPGPDLEESALALLPETPPSPLLLADSRSLWLLDFWAKALPQARFLLFYIRAETAVAHACQEGIEPLLFLESWQAAGRQLLAFQRRHRRRSLLLDAEAACRQPLALVEACAGIGLALASLPECLTPAPVPALERMLAGYLAAQPSALSLEAELEASGQPLGAAASAPLQPEELVAGYVRRKEDERRLRRELAAALEKLRIAGQTHEEQGNELRRLQEQITQMTKTLAEQTKLAAERQAQLEQAQQAEQKLETAGKEAVKENELLLLQLHQVQEEIEATFLGKQELEQTGNELKTQNQKLETELSRLTKTLAEQAKLAAERQAQLEQARQANQKLEASGKEAVQENELLLLQLHQIQEELEATFLRKQELEQTGSELKTQNQKLKTELSQLTKARDAEAKLAADKAAELTAGVERLRKARNAQAKLAAERQTQLDEAQQARATEEPAHRNAARENELLRQQLRKVQEELETIFLQKKQLEQGHAAQQKQLDKLKMDLKNSSLKYQELERELDHVKAAKDREIEVQRQRVDRLKQTASWKITAPVRALAKPFKRALNAEDETKEQVRLLKDSGLFDETWYLSQYADMVDGIDPVEHYLRQGAENGCNPSPAFNGRGYLETNPDIVKMGMNPLLHYVKFGKAEGRKGFEPVKSRKE